MTYDGCGWKKNIDIFVEIAYDRCIYDIVKKISRAKGVSCMDVLVCIGSSCHLKGSHAIIQALKRLIDTYGVGDKVALKGSFCMGNCTAGGVSVKIGDQVFSVTPDTAESFFETEIMGRVQA